MSHRKQHFIPQSYLKPWCDPNKPLGETPYVWVFAKDGNEVRNKAPVKIFRETDLYTIKMPDGTRDLTLENGLAELESRFCQVRDKKIQHRQMLSLIDRFVICAFIAAMHARTPKQREHMANQWGKVLKRMDQMIEWAKTATPEQKEIAASLSPPTTSEKGTFSYDDVKEMADPQTQTLMVSMIQTETPLLAKMDFLVLQTSLPQGFITSDAPCVWFDPEGCKRPPFYSQPALIYPTTEIRLPISPRQLIVLSRRELNGYAMIESEKQLDELNRITRFYAHEYFVANSSVKKDIWFDLGVEPEDSWNKTHPRADNK